MSRWTRKDLIGLDELSAEELWNLLDTARAFKGVGERSLKKVPALRGRTLVNFFVEPSTRTRTSFELAAMRLSADVVNISAGASSLQKGETSQGYRAKSSGAAGRHHRAAPQLGWRLSLSCGKARRQHHQRRRRRARTSHAGPAGYVYDSCRSGAKSKVSMSQLSAISSSAAWRAQTFTR